MPTAARSFSTARYILEIDGHQVPVRSVIGGMPYGEVVNISVGPDAGVKKHISSVKYDDFVVTCGLDAPIVTTLISGMLQHKSTRSNGAIIATDADFKERSRLEFRDALLTEVVFPRLDASSKDAGFLTLRFAPEHTRRVINVGGAATAKLGEKQKAWMLSNFQVALPDAMPTNRISAVSEISITRTMESAAIGAARDAARQPTQFEIAHVTFDVSQADEREYYDWFDRLVVRGEEQEKEMSIAYLDPTLKNTLAKLTLGGVGCFKVEPVAAAPGAEAIARTRVSCYIETAAFALTSASAPAGPASTTTPTTPASPATPTDPATPAALTVREGTPTRERVPGGRTRVVDPPPPSG